MSDGKNSEPCRLQVLVAAMHQSDRSLIEKMNLRSDAVICNQGDRNGVEEFTHGNNTITYVHSTLRGVGRNRNYGIANATGDILLFADQDVRYHDNYVEIIMRAYDECPEADLIFFNVKRINDSRSESTDAHPRRVTWFSCLRYGTLRVSVRKTSLQQANVWFSLLFGGGAKYGFGEDSLFISDCIRRGMKAYASDFEIGVVDQKDSSWFSGYNDDYFRDKGTLFVAISKGGYYLLAAHYLIKHKEEYRGKSLAAVWRLMNEGKKRYHVLNRGELICEK